MESILRKAVDIVLKANFSFTYGFLAKALALLRLIDDKKDKSRLVENLSQRYPNLKVCLYDIGAAGGLEKTFRPLLKLNNFQAVGFEPDTDNPNDFNTDLEIKTYPIAIAGKKGDRELYITRLSHCSSLYPPNLSLLREFPISDFFEVTRRTTVNVTSIEDFMTDFKTDKPDYLKIDVQGAEFEILSNQITIVKNLVGIYLETRLREVYEGESLFHDIHPFLLNLGFRLISCKSSPFFSGEVIELNVAYVKSVNYLATEEELIKALLFCVCHGNLNYAAHLIRSSSIINLNKDLLLKMLSRNTYPSEDFEVSLLKKMVKKGGIYQETHEYPSHNIIN
jgi:FkbM family methyltransferase